MRVCLQAAVRHAAASERLESGPGKEKINCTPGWIQMRAGSELGACTRIVAHLSKFLFCNGTDSETICFVCVESANIQDQQNMKS